MKYRIFSIIAMCFVLMTGCSDAKCTLNSTLSDFTGLYQDNNTEGAEFRLETQSNLDYSILPEFLNGCFDYGVYESPIRVPNPDYFDEIRVSSDNRLIFPELVVLTGFIDLSNSSPCIWECSDEKMVMFFGLLKSAGVSSMDDAIIAKISEVDKVSELSVVILTGSARYATVSISCCNNDIIVIRISQEEQEEICTTTCSEPLRSFLFDESRRIM